MRLTNMIYKSESYKNSTKMRLTKIIPKMRLTKEFHKSKIHKKDPKRRLAKMIHKNETQNKIVGRIEKNKFIYVHTHKHGWILKLIKSVT